MSIDITRTLFVGDLSVYCTEPELRQLFQNYGTIDDIRLKKTTANETRLGYGFIQFVDREAAQNAMMHLNGIMFLGRVMKINWATPKSSSKKLVIKPPKKAEAAQVHVSFISRQVDVIITEASVRKLFLLCGEVTDVTFKKCQVDQYQKVQHGYGFVHFPLTEEGVRSACNAVKAFHQVTIENVTYDCSMSCVLEDYLEIIAQRKRDDSLHQFEKSLMERNLIYKPTISNFTPNQSSFSTPFPSRTASPRTEEQVPASMPTLYRKEMNSSFNPSVYPSQPQSLPPRPPHYQTHQPHSAAFISSLSSTSSSFSEDSFLAVRDDSFDSSYHQNPFDCFGAIPQNSFDWLREMTQE